MVLPRQAMMSILIALITYGFAASYYSDNSLLAQNPTIKIDVDLVAVTVTVTDSRNQPLTDLRPENFQIWEDKIEQQIEYFSEEDAPISLGIIFDVSGSMAAKIATARDAAVAFLRNGNPEDEYFLVEFSNRAAVSQDFSTDVARLQKQIVFTSAQGNTAMYDAVYLGLEKLKHGTSPRKALLLITDGQDNHSRYSASNLKEFLKEKDVQVYAIGIEEFGAMRRRDAGRVVIEEIADMSGGRAFFINSAQELEDVCLKISALLKSQYVIGYKSTNPAKDGKWRKIRIRLNPPQGLSHLSVRSRVGYYAPMLEARPASN